jgi:ATP-dependent helicase/nuclease subunit A
MSRHPATERQVQAADPAASTWLSANAGSGKTRVLTDRVARLLLEGVDPQNILCLTYTKAAAAEMQNRLFKRLGKWAMQDDAPLIADLRELGATGTLTTPRLAQARRLFAQAMEVPGGLRIQTIHSFCAGLLRRFPLEAGVSPRFAEMEDRAAALLRAEVVDELAMGQEANVLHDLARHFTGDDFERLLESITGRRDAFMAMPDEAALRRTLELAPGLTTKGFLANILAPQDVQDIGRLIALCRTGSPTDCIAAEKLAAIDFDSPLTFADLAVMEGVFLFGATAANPFGPRIDSFPTVATRKKEPELITAINDLMERVSVARDDRLRLAAFDRTMALYAFATAFVPAYEARKLQRGMLDFDDLIGKARQLLTDPAVAQWVLFRLDGGIDHILVDEAQDTSPGQWAVIRSLAQEFAAGEGAQPDRERTVFVVGDKKQSIYSFQGADPEAFDRMQAHFATELGQIGRVLNDLTLDYSFRSAQGVLRVVDLVFSGAMRDGLGLTDPYHLAFHEAMPGRVDLWPPEPKADDAKEDRDWFDPVDSISDTHHTVRLAARIADAAAEMIRSGTVPAKDGQGFGQRRISEGDILILVQRRSDLFSEIIRALKAKGLRVAGADRLRVGAEIAVRDIAALLRFLALQEDDLSLAAALRSPLFGWSEQDLFTLAHHRPDNSRLWQALRGSHHVDTLGVLDDLRSTADFLRPYDLINRILTRHDGRRKLLARLGPEAEDGIDALLTQALAYEQGAVPGLTGFLEWMQTDDLEVKRQVDAAGDQIRVMTVHGAKGLESPVVILPDCAKRPVRANETILPAEGTVLWATAVGDMPPAMRHVREGIIAGQERERRRLLYVAMTRAESWLIVCAAGDTGKGSDSWHAMVAEGMTQAGAVAQDYDGRMGLRYCPLDWADLPMMTRPPNVARAVIQPELPDAPKPGAQIGTLSPSDLGGAKVMPGEISSDADAEREAALARGRIVHVLLEHLPDIAPDRRLSHAKAILAAAADPDDAMPADMAALIDDVMAMIDRPSLAPLFEAGVLAEVDVTAEVMGRRLHGAVDRLIVTPDRITAVDFKTNRIAPRHPADVPEGILRQMGAYQAMLEHVFAGRDVSVSVLWTATGELMPLPRTTVMAALQRSAVP